MYQKIRGMTKIHPNANASTHPSKSDRENNSKLVKWSSEKHATVLTVWKKSLILNCNGYTVFDDKGNLVFRVDNYMAANKGEIVLMDASGKALFTIRRKKLSLGDTWVVYEGEASRNPRYSVRKHVSLLNGKSLAHVSDTSVNGCTRIVYEIEGTYAQRSCAILDGNKRKVAEIKQKESVRGVGFGTDVFRLIVQPEMETRLAMAIVILLDQMFGSFRRSFG